MRVAACFYGDVRASVNLADRLITQGHSVDIYVHKRFVDPYPSALAPRCCWLEEPRPISRPEGVSEEQMWVYWSMARLGKMVIQTEQKEGRYALIAFASPNHCLTELPTNLLDGKVHTLNPERLAIGPSTDMQLYLNKVSQLHLYCERFSGPLDDRLFTEWCLRGMNGEKPASNWVEDLR